MRRSSSWCKILDGTATEAAWHTLAFRINVGQAVATLHYADNQALRDAMDAAVIAVAAVGKRFANRRALGVTGDEFRAIGQGLNLTDDMQRLHPPPAAGGDAAGRAPRNCPRPGSSRPNRSPRRIRMTTITTSQQEPAVPYVQRVAQIICTGLYPEAHAAGKTVADFPKATRQNLLTIAEAILVETTTEALAAERYAWWVTGLNELDGLAPAQLVIGGALDTTEGTPLAIDAHQRRHFLKPWRERLAMLLQLLVLPQHESGALPAFPSSRSWSGAELEAAMGSPRDFAGLK
ncbi:hypothetical protein [Cupriavidus nantongensis]|uniref:hypothetical protein n=1 Tax=Cupriavidus nantongensis TaxID=1796606 RepID=UPI0022467F4A|nr:hypothetical protein [Cupriavidus nantongensis]